MCVCVLPAGALIIQNASGIQIGSNNQMSIKSCDSCSSALPASTISDFSIKEGIQKYGKLLTTVVSIKQNQEASPFHFYVVSMEFFFSSQINDG